MIAECGVQTAECGLRNWGRAAIIMPSNLQSAIYNPHSKKGP